MSDLVERPDDNDPFNAGWNACYREAADEIERLRLSELRLEAARCSAVTEIERLEAAVGKLRAALDRLSKVGPYETLDTVRAFARLELEEDK